MAHYLIADTHFNHKNIIQYGQRPFKDVEEMNHALITNWNRVVRDREDDVVMHLGDFGFGPVDALVDIARQLHGTKYFLPGNHDHRSLMKKLIASPFGRQEFPFRRLTTRPYYVQGPLNLFSHKPFKELNEVIRAFGYNPTSQAQRDRFEVEGLRTVYHGHTHQNFAPPLPLVRHVCVSVEQTAYSPVRYVWQG